MDSKEIDWGSIKRETLNASANYIRNDGSPQSKLFKDISVMVQLMIEKALKEYHSRIVE